MMKSRDSVSLMRELLNKDRLEYMEMLITSGGGVSSFEVAKKILQSKGIMEEEEIKKVNIVVNKRLRRLVKYGILVSDEGKYYISNLGHLLMNLWKELNEDLETMDEFRIFFDSHHITDLPREFFCQIYKLKRAKITLTSLQWAREVREYMGRIERKFYNLTEYIHDFPEEIIEKKESREIEEIVIIYEFKKYPELNYPDEKKKLLDRLNEAGAEFRYLNMENNKHPIGIRIVDEKWATFGLTRIADGILDRERAFIGDDKDFISWCRGLMYHIWHFEAKPLDVEEILEKGKK